jgi:GNAT superfamily N-acetyltransferase
MRSRRARKRWDCLERNDLPMIASAASDDEIAATYDVMSQLRPHIERDAYVPTVRRMMQGGYLLATSSDETGVRGVAGYRFFEMLYCGLILYVDDLITDENNRSQGHGHALLEWLKEQARAAGCTQLHLDSGVQREQAHKFYFREGMTINAYHFRVVL